MKATSTEPAKKAGDRPTWHPTDRELKGDQTSVTYRFGCALIRLSAAMKNFPQAATCRGAPKSRMSAGTPSNAPIDALHDDPEFGQG